MSEELLFTSSPRGLRPGSSGFCTVVSTEGLIGPLTQGLEALSGYRHLYPLGDPQAAQNPVNFSHVRLSAAGKTYDILSRISDYGRDYSQRTNKLAHHVVVDPAERPAGGPAWLLLQPGFMETTWDGHVGVKPTGRRVPVGGDAPAICRTWQEVTGDAGWAGILAQSWLDNPQRLAFLRFAPGTPVLELIREAIALIPPDRRWEITFSTFATSVSQNVTCQWRCVVEGSKEAHEARRFARELHLSLSTSQGAAPDSPAADAARQGKYLLEPISTPSLVTKPHVIEVPEPVNEELSTDRDDEPDDRRYDFDDTREEIFQAEENVSDYEIPQLPARAARTHREGPPPLLPRHTTRNPLPHTHPVLHASAVRTPTLWLIGISSVAASICLLLLLSGFGTLKAIATARFADKLAADKLAADKLAADKLAADKLAADKLAADKLAADKLATDKLAADKLAADKLAADKLAADKLAADKLAADKLAADKLAADKLAADKLAADKLAAEKKMTPLKPLKDGPLQNSAHTIALSTIVVPIETIDIPLPDSIAQAHSRTTSAVELQLHAPKDVLSSHKSDWKDTFVRGDAVKVSFKDPNGGADTVIATFSITDQSFLHVEAIPTPRSDKKDLIQCCILEVACGDQRELFRLKLARDTTSQSPLPESAQQAKSHKCLLSTPIPLPESLPLSIPYVVKSAQVCCGNPKKRFQFTEAIQESNGSPGGMPLYKLPSTDSTPFDSLHLRATLNPSKREFTFAFVDADRVPNKRDDDKEANRLKKDTENAFVELLNKFPVEQNLIKVFLDQNSEIEHKTVESSLDKLAAVTADDKKLQMLKNAIRHYWVDLWIPAREFSVKKRLREAVMAELKKAEFEQVSIGYYVQIAMVDVFVEAMSMRSENAE